MSYPENPAATAPEGAHAPTASDIDQTKHILREICRLASTAMGLSERPELAAPGDAGELLQNRLQVLHRFIDRMGWVADVGLRKLGDRGAFERAEDWMLPGA